MLDKFIRFTVWIFLIAIVGLSEVRNKLVGMDKISYKGQTWFAWFPVKTKQGWVWFKTVKRYTTCNAGMISIKSFRYEEIDV